MKRFVAALTLLVALNLTVLTVAATGLSSPQTAPTADQMLPQDDQWEFLLNPDRDYAHTIVNFDHPYEFDGEYDQALRTDLTYRVDEVYEDIACAEKATMFAFELLKARLKNRYHLDIGLLGSTAGWRSAEDQDWIYSITEDKVKVPAGYSEHHTGLVLSIVILAPDENGEEVWQTPTLAFEEEYPELLTPLKNELASYGFIVRYPEDKEDITGIGGTYRDIRFVGSSEVATFIRTNHLCLEEYVEMNK